MDVRDILESLMKEGLGTEEGEEVLDCMKARTEFAYDMVNASIAKGKNVNWPKWLYENKGEIGVVQLILPEGMADALKSMGERHQERCEGCAVLELCKKAGIYDDPVRAAMTEIFKVGFSTIAERALRDKF